MGSNLSMHMFAVTNHMYMWPCMLLYDCYGMPNHYVESCGDRSEKQLSSELREKVNLPDSFQMLLAQLDLA